MRIQLRGIILNQGTIDGTSQLGKSGNGAKLDRFEALVLGAGGAPIEVVAGKPFKGIVFLNHNLVLSSAGNRMYLQNQIIEVSDEQFKASQEIAIKKVAERAAANLQEFPEWTLVFNQFALADGPSDEMIKLMVDRDTQLMISDHKEAKAARNDWRKVVRQESAAGLRKQLDGFGRPVNEDGTLADSEVLAAPTTAPNAKPVVATEAGPKTGEPAGAPKAEAVLTDGGAADDTATEDQP